MAVPAPAPLYSHGSTVIPPGAPNPSQPHIPHQLNTPVVNNKHTMVPNENHPQSTINTLPRNNVNYGIMPNSTLLSTSINRPQAGTNQPPTTYPLDIKHSNTTATFENLAPTINTIVATSMRNINATPTQPSFTTTQTNHPATDRASSSTTISNSTNFGNTTTTTTTVKNTTNFPSATTITAN